MTMPSNATTPLLSSPQAVKVTTYKTAQDDEEAGEIQTKSIIEQQHQIWLWRSNSYKWSLAAFVLLVVVFSCLELALLRLNLPAVDPQDKDALKFPKNLEDLRRLNAILSVYINQHFGNVYVTFFITYVYLQSFSVPGSMWLSILGGALFNFWTALFTVSLCSAIGSCVAFVISSTLGSVAVMRLIGDRLSKWNEQLVQHKQHMLNYMIVLRVAPLPPNWTVNLGAPHLNVPISAFFWGTFIGVAGPSFIHVQAGAALDRLSSSDELNLFTPINVACLVAVGVVALIPVFIRRRYDV
ncbi:snare associated Golgi protein-domain-containing protein [Phycomyces nitens]|nr:snare associated Golgi protein-domain-containing protein [Phycomyces nitens]